jgi:D-alanyl-D-alanine carboxypeptidase
MPAAILYFRPVGVARYLLAGSGSAALAPGYADGAHRGRSPTPEAGTDMRAAKILLALPSALVALWAGMVPHAAADLNADLTAALDDAINAKFAELGIPGAIVGVSIPGTLDYVRALGVSDSETNTPMTVDDHTRIGSVTKTFTGTAVLQLVDQGRIRLSDPISRYVDGVPGGDQITIDMLGRMRSGLYNYTEDEQFQARIAQESPAGPGAAAFTPRQLADIAFAHPPDFPPGTKYEYSNTNAVLLGMVVEKVTGQPFGQYLRQHVLDPLGLAHTSYPANGLLPQPFTHGYSQTPDGAYVDTTLWNPSDADAAGKMVSTYGDLKTWAAALGRGALLDPATQAKRTQFGDALPGLRYGFLMFDLNGWIGHDGGIPGYVTVSVYLPERNATLVVIANSEVARDPAGRLAAAVTSIVTPDHVYEINA